MNRSLKSKFNTALRGWLAQRLTGAVMAVFTLVVVGQVIFSKGAMNYDQWAGIFSAQWMKALTLIVILGMGYHAWLGMKEIYMDYIKPLAIRLLLQVLTLAWLIGCVGWAIQVLWRF